MSPRTLKILAVSYLIKTLVVGVAWLAIPDLPQRAASRMREAWTWVASARVSATRP
jgi:hypothetical protein